MWTIFFSYLHSKLLATTQNRNQIEQYAGGAPHHLVVLITRVFSHLRVVGKAETAREVVGQKNMRNFARQGIGAE